MATVKGGNSSGPSNVAIDTVSSEDVQLVKVTFGASSAATRVTSAAPLPVDASGVAVPLAAGTANIGDVDVLTVPAPLSTTGTGTEATALRVTVATDSTGVLSVDDNGASLTVDVGTALPAGTNAIGKLAANSGVDIGDVDVTSVIPGTGATNLGKAIDSVAGATDTGVAVLAIRDDTLTTLTPAETDWAPLRVNSTGALHVTGGGGGTQYVEDVAHVSGDTGTMLLAVRNDPLTALAGTTGDYIPLQTDANGNLSVAVASGTVTASGSITTEGVVAHDASGSTADPLLVGGYASAAAPTAVSADGDAVNAWFLRNGAQSVVVTAAGALIGGDATNGLDVDITRMAALVAGSANIGDVDVLTIAAGDNNIGNVDVVTLPALVAGSANIGDVDVLTVPAPLSTTGTGTEATALRVTVATDSTGVLSVDDNGASFTVDAAGDIAHDAADSGNPVKVGGKAANALPTAVANNDRANFISDLWGRQLTAKIDPAMQASKSFSATSTATGHMLWNPAAGNKIAVTSLLISATGATGTGPWQLWFGDAADTTFTDGTDQVLARGNFIPSATLSVGLVSNYDPPIFCTTANRKLRLSTASSSQVDVTLHGYEWA